MDGTLIQSQIINNCRLALPEGLRDLMSDISREVLRAQPSDLNAFIADYLSALLLARDSLSIACKICRDICECSCIPHLEEELRYNGLEETEVELVKDIVLKYFEKGEVNESNLLMELFKQKNLDGDMMQDIQEAVRRSYFRNQMEHGKTYDMPIRAREAVENTLRIYQDSDEDTNDKVTKIQAMFRGHLVRKNQKQVKKKVKGGEKPKLSMSSVSSQSLPGSYMCLPKYVPYSTHYMTFNEMEEHKQEENIALVNNVEQNKKKIGFNNNYEIDTFAIESDGSENSIEEHVYEDNLNKNYVSEEEIEEVEDLDDEEVDVQKESPNNLKKNNYEYDMIKLKILNSF